MKGFSQASHVQVKNAGHEQAKWSEEVADNIIPSFIKGKHIESGDAYYSDLDFLPLIKEDAHE